MTDPALPTVVDELADLPTRIRASAARLTDLTKQLANERETRDRLLVEAVDHASMPGATAARYADITHTHLLRILAASSED